MAQGNSFRANTGGDKRFRHGQRLKDAVFGTGANAQGHYYNCRAGDVIADVRNVAGDDHIRCGESPNRFGGRLAHEIQLGVGPVLENQREDGVVKIERAIILRRPPEIAEIEDRVWFHGHRLRLEVFNVGPVRHGGHVGSGGDPEVLLAIKVGEGHNLFGM